MEPMMNEKRVMSSLVPYRKRGTEIEYYIQRRSNDAKINPGLYGMWGGKAEEGETPEETLLREIREELAYVPERAVYFCRYEFAQYIFQVFVEEVGADFESKVQILEGDYGTWLTLSEIMHSTEMSPNATTIFPQLDAALRIS